MPRATGWLQHIPHADIAPALYDWLAHTGSLTDRIRSRCPAFALTLLAQHVARPNRDERAPLKLRGRHLALVREVVLRCGDTPLVFAHSVLPRRHIRGAWHLVAGLGTRPLGALLFADPRITREPFRYRRLDARHPLYRRAAAALGPLPATLWARRSVFTRAGRPILVSEVFLPEILRLER